ncbi:transglutaminaseTgpA domain-containing protein [Nocardiopsis sp. N85]|uniref:DUF3488 and transglutaminase-like domain-containing protein n=1 Tax=Nocardiopsis sp. N85 TaxID=3029400 RepID=UPI00237F6C35|nr:transglutaminase domain-containing protein [Nocardiopsis sp. N85]MDE3723149.1 transglutaminaseTgpA domain-containing protein [Nocardiopsis sp. N85]
MVTLTRERAGVAPGEADGERRVPRPFPAVAGLALAASAGGVALAPGYATPVPVQVVLPVCALLAVVVTLAARARLRPSLVVPVGLPLPLAAVVVCAAVLPGQGTGVVDSTVEALLHSGARILTSAAPTPLSVDTLTAPLLATWLTGVGSVLLWHGRRPALAILPGLLWLVGAVVLNGPVAPPGFPSIGLVAVASILLMSAVSDERSSAAVGGSPPADLEVEDGDPGTVPGERAGRILTTGLVTVLAAAVTVFGGPVLLADWETRPHDPRASVTPPLAPEDALNPLGHLSEWAAEPDVPLLTVRSEEPVELRWVALADFTGTTWLPEGGYRAAGEVLPAPEPAPPHAVRVGAEVVVGDGLPGGWVPVVGAPHTIDLPSVGHDARSGVVVLREGRVAGAEYAVTGDVGDWRPTELTVAHVPAGAEFDRYRELPAGAPPLLNDVVAAVSGQGPPYERARLIAEYLRESHHFSPETPGGHGYAHIARVLAPPGGQGGGGTSEQFASAFALLARAAGLPSRVVVGFGPGDDAGDGARTVRTGDAVAWGEVYFEGFGWVPFSVTPGEEGEDAPEETSTGSAGEDDDEEAERQGAQGGGADDSAGRSPGREDSWTRPALFAGGALIVLASAIPTARLIRRWRRLRSGPPERRVLGSWWELRDALRQCGVPLPAGRTVGETLAAAGDLLPGSDRAGTRDGLLPLGRAVNWIGFAENARVSREAAAQAAGTVRRYSSALRRTRSRARRALWWFDPRPLFWRAR